MKNFAKKIILILITGCGFISSILMAAGANASGGAVFVRGSSASVSGGGGYGTNACPYSAGDYQFQSSVECTGVSWIFYKSTGKTAKEIKFPYIASSQYGNWADLTVTIPKSYAEHTDAGGGFWHYGINSNGAGITQNGGTIKKDGGMYGHWATLTWGDATYNSNQSWISYKAPIGNLNQTLPQGSTSSNALYTNANTGKDSRLATVSKDFWEAWLIDNGGDEDKAREAWKTATGAYTHYGDDGYFPSWLSAFCWWDYADYWQTSQVVATSGATKKDKSASATDDLKTNTANVALTVKAGEAVVIDFRHNIFSNKDKETGQQWEV
ncbi:hypothetical protein IJ135_02470, partial [Candidatus Saccharibacteria bacterium]|nr:hypothetical protein [Candidatus Saccharibacteria bacterium]